VIPRGSPVIYVQKMQSAAAAAVGFPEREGNDDDDDDVEESERGVRGGSASNHVTDRHIGNKLVTGSQM